MVLHAKHPGVATSSPEMGEKHLTPQWYTHSYNRPAVYRVMARCSPFLPRPLRFGCARLVACLLRHLLPHEYAAAQRNLARVLPDVNPVVVAQRTRALFRHFAYYFTDLLSLNLQPFAVQQRYVHRVYGSEHLQAALASGRGFVAATAHLGNWDLGGRLLASCGKTVHILMAQEQDVAIQRLLRAGDNPGALRFVTNNSVSVFMQLFLALRRGDVVAFQVDRGTGHRSDVPVEFFGTPAPFPSGPLVLAGAAHVPVLPCFCVMRLDHNYDIFVDEAIPVVRGQEVIALQQLVRVLEQYVAMAPDQWFNFYDIWHNSPATR